MKHARRLAASLALGVAALAICPVQPANAVPDTSQARDAPATASLPRGDMMGTIRSDDHARAPLRRVLVTVFASPGPPRIALTDDNGQFRFDALAVGEYTLTATKIGWVTSYYGSGKPGRGPGRSVIVAAGTMVTADVHMTRGAVLTGRLLDEQGRPARGVVHALEHRTIGGQRFILPLRPASTSTVLSGLPPRFTAVGSAMSDDRGEYRIYGLAPGSYVVYTQPDMTTPTAARVTSPEEVAWVLKQRSEPPLIEPLAPRGTVLGFAPVYYPGTTDPESATEIVVGAGEERTGLDFALAVQPLARIAGSLMHADGRGVESARVSLAPAGQMTVITPSDQRTTPWWIYSSGDFSFPLVRPGRYQVLARVERAPETAVYAVADVHVTTGDVEEVALTLAPAPSVRGRVVFEGQPPSPAELATLRVELKPPLQKVAAIRDPNREPHTGVIAADGTFSVPGVPPGAYAIGTILQAPAEGKPLGDRWLVKTVRWHATAVTDRPIAVAAGRDVSEIVLTLTDRPAEISGVITDSAGRGTPGFSILVLPVDRSAWTPASSRFRAPSLVVRGGKFHVGRLPPGDYYLAALTGIDELDVLDERFLTEVAASALKITLAEGEKRIQNLRIK
jgi:protocatechuate 3,4-dioxygenase beta subunit